MGEPAKDGGYKSRKLWFSVGTSCLIFASGFFFAALILEAVIMGLLGMAAIYVGGNAGTKFLSLRAAGKAADTSAAVIAAKTTAAADVAIAKTDADAAVKVAKTKSDLEGEEEARE